MNKMKGEELLTNFTCKRLASKNLVVTATRGFIYSLICSSRNASVENVYQCSVRHSRWNFPAT